MNLSHGERRIEKKYWEDKMMDAYATEEQQVEAIKNWFKKYGNMLSWALIVILASYCVWQYWNHHQNVVKNKASDQYAALLQAVEAQDSATIQTNASTLIKDYSNSVYAVFANFYLVDEFIKSREFDKAEEKLKWIVENANQPQLAALGQWRLMKLYDAQNKPDEVIAIYDSRKADTFLTLMAELKGDVLLKKGDKEGAMKAYKYAYDASPEEGMHGPLLKMKMDELGIATQEAKKS
jgi:predicted negative regulator of RcsB-dependent stress response